MDAARLERAERLTPIRWGLFGVAALIALGGAVPWIGRVREDRARHWSETLAWDRYRRHGTAKQMMRAHVDENVTNPVMKERAIEQYGLDKPPDGQQTAEPEPLNYLPPSVTVAAFIGALAAVVGADAVRRLQVDQIQAVAAAARRERAEKEARERAGEDNAAAATAPAGTTTFVRADVTTQPVMEDDVAFDEENSV